METLYQILGILAAGAIGWFLYRTIRSRPEQFSRERLSQSFFTMGILALILIAFVGALILFVRQ